MPDVLLNVLERDTGVPRMSHRCMSPAMSSYPPRDPGCFRARLHDVVDRGGGEGPKHRIVGMDLAPAQLPAENLEDYLEVLNRELAKPATKPDDPVFSSLSRLRSFGKRLSPTAINTIVKNRAKAAGIGRRITAHSCHTCTTLAPSNGVPLHQVQRHLRHKDVRTTLRYDREREARSNSTLDALPEVT